MLVLDQVGPRGPAELVGRPVPGRLHEWLMGTDEPVRLRIVEEFVGEHQPDVTLADLPEQVEDAQVPG
jgi:hypothetical protein